MNRILISACLMGAPVRYDGRGKLLSHALIDVWKEQGRLVSFCPEVSAGFQVPRPPAEIADGMNGEAVLDGRAQVIEIGGRDVTAQFVDGAVRTLEFAQHNDCRLALLIDGSPSCGSGFIYDGQFSGGRHAGSGVTAALLKRNGVDVFMPAEIEALATRLAALD